MPPAEDPAHGCMVCGTERDVRALHRIDQPHETLRVCTACLARRIVHEAESADEALTMVRGLPLSGYQAWRTDHRHLVLRGTG